MGLRIAALVSFIGLIIYLSAVFGPRVSELFSRRQELKRYIESRGLAGILIFIGFQVFQVVVAAVPGEIVQIAGGYIYGVFWGSLYLIIGVTIGSALNFFLARWLGYEIVKKIVPKKRLAQLHKLVGGPRQCRHVSAFCSPGCPRTSSPSSGLTPSQGRFCCFLLLAGCPLVESNFIGASFSRKIPQLLWCWQRRRY